MNQVNKLIRFPRKSIAEYKFDKLKGLFCIYKPPDMDLLEIFKKLRYQFMNGINEEPTTRLDDYLIKYDEQSDQIVQVNNLANRAEALGPRFVNKDFQMDFLHPLSLHDSGVVIASINDRKGLLEKVDRLRLMRTYEIKGRLGVCTDDFTSHGRLVNRATYYHVNKSKLDRVATSIQAVYQRQMMNYLGAHPNSQEAYEVASAGLVRPDDHKTVPLIYSIKCIEFDRPFFKFEVHIINENNIFLRNLINDIGIRLRTFAICVAMRRTRDGFASHDQNCLAYNEWTFNELYENTLLTTSKAKEYIHNFKSENNSSVSEKFKIKNISDTLM